MQTLSKLNVSQKRVFLRADLDVEVGPKIGEDLRLVSMKPTVDWLFEHGAKQVIIAGHMGRPTKPDAKLSTKQLVKPLQQILGVKITFLDKLKSKSDKVILLENLRFWPGEEARDEEFAKQLAALADVYINESFANSHRDHASISLLPTLLVHAAGLHLEQEIAVLSALLKKPKKPFVAIIGGAKLETKIPVISNLASRADYVLVGGALPTEIEMQGEEFAENVIIAKLNGDKKDIREDMIDQFVTYEHKAKTVVWNGDMGIVEKGFDKGTVAIAENAKDAEVSVVGGGDTVAFLQKKGLLVGFTHVSTGGGAMLEFLEGKTLPGIKALE